MEKNLILSKARSAVISRDFATAARMYRQLIDSDPSNVEYLKQLGSIYVQAGQDQKAISYYEQILTFYPHYIDAMTSLGAIYRRLKQYDKSIEILQRAHDEGRQLPTVNYNLGFTYKEMGNYDDAIDAFEMVIAKKPDDVLAHNHLGFIYYIQKLYDKSILAYKKGLQIDPNHPILNYNLARTYEAINNYSDAIRCYNNVLKTRPNWIDAITDYSNLLIRCQKNKDAQDVVQQAIKLMPSNTDLLTLLGNIYLKEYDFASAETTFKQALGLKDDDIKIICGLAEAQEKNNKPEKAVNTIQSALDMEPDNNEIKKQYARSLLSAKNYDKALETVQELYSKNAKDPGTLDLYGQYYMCQNDEESARKYYQQIQQVDSHYKNYLLGAAQRLNQIGNYSLAEKYAESFVDRRPNNPDGYSMLGTVYRGMGNLDKAREYFDKSASTVSPNVFARSNSDSVKQEIAKRAAAVQLPVEEAPVQETAPVEEVKAQPAVTETPKEEEDFDFASMGDMVPFQEKLIEEDGDFFDSLDDEMQMEEEPEVEEIEDEMEEPERKVPKLEDIAGAIPAEAPEAEPQAVPIDSAEDGGGAASDGEGGNGSGDGNGEGNGNSSADDAAANDFNNGNNGNNGDRPPYNPYDDGFGNSGADNGYNPFADDNTSPYQPPVPQPEPQTPQNPMGNYQPAYPPQGYANDLQAQAAAKQAATAAEDAMQAAMTAQMMAQDLALEQDRIKEETEKSINEAVKEALAKKAAEEQALKEQQAAKAEEETAAEPEEAAEESSEQTDDYPYEYTDVNPENEDELMPGTLEQSPDDEDPVLQDRNPFEVFDEEETEVPSEEDLTQTPEEAMVEAETEAVPEENSENISEAVTGAEAEPESENSEPAFEEETMPEAENDGFMPVDEDIENTLETNAAGEEADAFEMGDEDEDGLTAFASVEEMETLLSGSPELNLEGEPDAETIADAQAYDRLYSQSEGAAEEVPETAAEESDSLIQPIDMDFQSVDSIAPEVVVEDGVQLPETINEEMFDTVEGILNEPSEEDKALKEMLEKIELILQDDRLAKQYSKEIELFKKLRVLINFLPVSEKNSYLTHRMRMITEYIISKMSGRPGLLLTAESLLKSGTLGPEYSANLTKECDEELSNDLIRHVLKYMKELSSYLEDKTLAQSLIASADSILEQIELANQKSQIF